MDDATDYQDFVADLRGQTIVFSSVEENEETMAVFGVDQHLRQLSNGTFQAHMAVHSVGEFEFFSDRFKTAVSLHLAPPPDKVGILIPRTESGRFLASGENVAEDKMLVFPNTASGSDIVIPPLSGSDCVTIPVDRFGDTMRALCPTLDVPEHTTIYQGDGPTLNTISRRIVDVVSRREIDSEDAIAGLAELVVAWLGESAPYWGPESLTIDPERQRIAKNAREYLEEHYGRCIRMEDLCTEVGVGVRTLQRCFKEYFDVTVSEYLKTKRLDAVRRSLRQGHPTTTTVTEIALQHGFSHLGRFSLEFKERFGESPRATLAKKQSQKSTVREIPASDFLASADLLAEEASI